MSILMLSNGEIARKYCHRNNIIYQTFIDKLELVGDVDLAIEMARKVRGSKGQNATKYRVKGLSLRQYLPRNEYTRLLMHVHKKKVDIHTAVKNLGLKIEVEVV